MSLLNLRHEQPVEKTEKGRSGYPDGPQEQACQNMAVRMKMARLFKKYRDKMTFTRYDVTVTSDPPSVNEKISLTVYENEKTIPLVVRNCGDTAVRLSFWTSDLVRNIFTVRDCHGHVIRTLKHHPFGPGETYNIMVHFSSEDAGFYELLLVFECVTCLQNSQKFDIMRLLEVMHRTSFAEEPTPTTTNSLCNLQVVTQIRPEGVPSKIHLERLKYYPMPNGIKDLKKCNRALEMMPLTWENYGPRFHMMLHLEELQQMTDIEKLSQDVCIFRHTSKTDLFFLQIAGDDISSSSLMPKNRMVATLLHQTKVPDKEIAYKGIVQHVDGNTVYVQFNEKFESFFKKGMQFRVNFILNRTPLRTQHRAVEMGSHHRLKDVLFPTAQSSCCHSHLHGVIDLKKNPEQRTAVQHIVAASAKPAPYLLFGPPGTGKTLTLVDAIEEIVNTQPWCNILACAPSNSATDHLCEKILERGIYNTYRLYTLGFPVKKIPEKIKAFCNLNENMKTLLIPSKQRLMGIKIMLTSLQNAGRLVTGGIPLGHYTYLFVDEAGQATELECLIPISGLMDPANCQLVLSGDPKQLGPVITSQVAEKHGMGVSMLERLMTSFDLYKSRETCRFNNCYVTKLVRNFRSHPAILKIPNKLFYDGELQCHGSKTICNSYCKWECLPKKGFPLIFHGVAGTDQRDCNNPSVYNMAEVEVLKEYLKALIDHLHKKGVTKIGPSEIGIIAPYKNQVEKIQNALQTDRDLRKEDLENISVGTVEKFQGKEFSAILLSTVRSNHKLDVCNQHFTLGFVDDEKRFNVAMTRSRALLIVVGDPRVLKTDYIWNKFIHYCFMKGGYRGITVSEEELTHQASGPQWRVTQQLDLC